MTRKHWRRYLSYPLVAFLTYLGLTLVGFFPYAGLKRLARGLAPIFKVFYLPATKLTLANLRVAFPNWSPEKYKTTCHHVIQNQIQTFLEFLWIIRFPQKLTQIVDINNAETQEILKIACSSSGAMMITPHLGNWEVLGQLVAANGAKVCAVAHQIKNPWLDRVINRARQFHGIEIIPARGAVRGMLKCLRAGKPIGMLMDQNTRPHKGGTFVNYFGLPATTTRAPASLARKLNLPVIAAACIRENGHLSVCIARLPKPASDYESDAELTQDMISANEELIRRYPEQYAWLYRRWRYVPPNISAELQQRYPYYAKPYEAPRT